jgi:hypothetical protein
LLLAKLARPYLPNVLALQVKISDGIKIYQALSHASSHRELMLKEQSKLCSARILHAYIAVDFSGAGCFQGLAIHRADTMP